MVSFRRFPQFVLGLGLAFSACNGTDFSGGSAKQAAVKKTAEQPVKKTDVPNSTDSDKGTKDDGGDGGGDGKGGKDAGGSDASGNVTDQSSGKTDGGQDGLGKGGEDILETDGDLISCPKTSQRILILDFKSGWWAGDGGQFFDKVLTGLHQQCSNNITIEYHHIILNENSLFGATGDAALSNSMSVVPGGTGLQPVPTNFSNSFKDASWKSYAQIWILSGARSDPEDLNINNPFFQKVLAQIPNVSANLFLGAGFGSIVHFNAVADAAGVDMHAMTSQAEDGILNVMAGVQVSSTLKKGTQLKDHVLFSRGITDIADNMVVGGQPAAGDYLSGSALPIIATDSAGRPVIAAGKIGNRRIVTDAGLQRYYSVYQDLSPGTFQLMKNLIVYLSK